MKNLIDIIIEKHLIDIEQERIKKQHEFAMDVINKRMGKINDIQKQLILSEISPDEIEIVKKYIFAQGLCEDAFSVKDLAIKEVIPQIAIGGGFLHDQYITIHDWFWPKKELVTYGDNISPRLIYSISLTKYARDNGIPENIRESCILYLMNNMSERALFEYIGQTTLRNA